MGFSFRTSALSLLATVIAGIFITTFLALEVSAQGVGGAGAKIAPASAGNTSRNFRLED